MIENNYFSNNAGIREHFDHVVNWTEVIDALENGFTDAADYEKTGNENLAMAPASHEEAREYYRTILDSLGELIGREMSPSFQEMRKGSLEYREGKVHFPAASMDVFRAVESAGLLPYSFGRHHGGLGLPLSVQAMILEIISRADAGFAVALGCFNIGEILERFGSSELAAARLPDLVSGRRIGAMALTEPDNGSDLAGVQTRAIRDAKGVWRISGTKRFITHACGYGDRPADILTLARTGSAESGARGLSFFLVRSEDVGIEGIEKKMGLHLSPTCEVSYDDTPGEIIGGEGEGLIKGAMAMMNNARLAVAAQSLGIAQAAASEARKYAGERMQFKKTIDEIPAVKIMLERMEREIVAARTLLYQAARSVDLYVWSRQRLRDEGVEYRKMNRDPAFRRWFKIAGVLTPIAKYYISELCNRIAYDAQQIFGGSGYIEDYEIARIYRDARITTIYEGTTQLQIVAAVGGIASGMTENGFLREYLETESKDLEMSAEQLEVNDAFEDIVNLYRELAGGESRDTFAFHLVQSAARFFMGLFLEKSNALLPYGKQEARQRMTRDFHIDSLALMEGSRLRLRKYI